MKNFVKFLVSSVLLLAVALSYTSNTFAASAPDGTNILGPDGTVYRIMNNARYPYTSAGAFLSYKFNTWAGLKKASSEDMSLGAATYVPSGTSEVKPYYIPPRNGSLILDQGTVYLITGGLRAGFSSEEVFFGLGFSYTNVYPGDTSFMVTLAPINSAMQVHPNGTLINDAGTLYVMHDGFRMGVPSMAILESWGYWAQEAVPANMYDRQAEVSGILETRMPNQMSI